VVVGKDTAVFERPKLYRLEPLPAGGGYMKPKGGYMEAYSSESASDERI